MKRVFFSLLMVLSLATFASAGPIVLSGDTAWENAPAGAFWNNQSWDGNGAANIGNFLSNDGLSDIPEFYSTSPGIALTWLGSGNTTFGFTTPITGTYLNGVTAWKDTDTWGFYEISPGIVGLWMQTPYNTWYSGTLDEGVSHFALFQGSTPNVWYVGMEDIQHSWTNDWDYNDVMVRLESPTPVPEPGSALMIMTGLGFVGMLRRKWRQ
jgi:hypothetical protein